MLFHNNTEDIFCAMMKDLEQRNWTYETWFVTQSSTLPVKPILIIVVYFSFKFVDPSTVLRDLLNSLLIYKLELHAEIIKLINVYPQRKPNKTQSIRNKNTKQLVDEN